MPIEIYNNKQNGRQTICCQQLEKLRCLKPCHYLYDSSIYKKYSKLVSLERFNHLVYCKFWLYYIEKYWTCIFILIGRHFELSQYLFSGMWGLV